MGKKQSGMSFREALEGGLQPISQNNTPDTFTPIQSGNEIDNDLITEKFKLRSSGNQGMPDEPEASRPMNTSQYGGKYFRGSMYDNEQRSIQGENQSITKKLANGILGGTLSVGTKFLTGAAEVTGGAYDLITNAIPGVAEERKNEGGNAFPHLFENFMTKSFDYIENDLIKEKLMPVYSQQKDFSGSLLTQMSSAKFWASDVTDALAFMTSAAIPVAGFTKAAKLMGLADKVVDALKGGKEVLELTTKGKKFVTRGTALWNTTMEAAQEGVDTLNNIREDLAYKDYKVPYKMLDDSQKKEVNQVAGEHAADVFKSNAAILLGPNLIQARFFVGAAKDVSSKLKKGVRLGTLSPSDISVFKKSLTEGGLGLLSEGAWEEGMQAAVQNYEKKAAGGDAFTGRGLGYAYEWMSNFNSTEGQKAMFLGGLIGLGMGAASGVRDANAEKKFVTEYKSKFDKLIKEELPKIDAILSSDIKHPFKTFVRDVEKDGKKERVTSILNDKGKKEIDNNNAIKMLLADTASKELVNELMVAAFNDDSVHEKFAINSALSQLLYKYVSNPVFSNSDEAYDMLKTRNPIGELAKDEDFKEFDFQYMESKLEEMKREWDNSINKLSDRDDLNNKDVSFQQFRRKVEKAHFYNKVKLSWLSDVDGDVNDKTQLEEMRKDAEESIGIFENKSSRDKLYREYTKSNEDSLLLSENLANEERKDPNSLETKKLKYLSNENKIVYGNENENDRFTITQDMQKKSKSGGLKAEHLFNIGADAIVGMRLENEIRKVKEGSSPLSSAVSILENPTEGKDIESRGMYNVTKKDIDAVIGSIEKAREYVEKDIYTEEQYSADMDAQDEIIQSAEEITPEMNESIETNRQQYTERFEESERRLADLEEAVSRLYDLSAVENGPGILGYKDGISKLKDGDDVFQRAVADQSVKEAKAVSSLVKANVDSYNNLNRVKKIIDSLKNTRELYTKTDLKDRLEKNAFKGFIESLDKSIATLENDIVPIVQKNYDEKRNIDKQSQINRNKKRFSAFGITVNDQDHTVTDSEAYNLLVDTIGEPAVLKIIKEAKESDELGEEFAYHEVFVDKIVSLLKQAFKKDSKSKDHFMSVMGKVHENNLKSFIQTYDDITESNSKIAEDRTMIDYYRINPVKVIKDILISLASVRNSNVTRKTAIDRFKNNNDIYELLSNLDSEDETGYLGLQKDKLLGLLHQHISNEATQDLFDYIESEYNLEDQLKVEKDVFAESSIAPTSQQLNTLRQAVRWFKKPLAKITSTDKVKHRFKNWLFIKGSAGSGKTQVMIRYFLKSIGIKSNEILMLAPHKNAQDMLEKQALSTNKPILIKDFTAIPDDVNLIIIDEIAAINNPDLITLSNKIQQLNESRKVPVRVISLGDPNQVSAQQNNIKGTSTPVINETIIYGTERITVVDPLTIKHRSIIPEINEILDVFEDNSSPVEGITVYASSPVGTEAIGIHAGDMNGMNVSLKAHMNNGRSKVIIVQSEAQKNDIAKMYPQLADFIYTYTEVAGVEFDEAYVALSPNQFNDTVGFNKAYYTAASRAKQYIYLLDNTKSFASEVSRTMAENYSGKGESSGSYIADRQKILDERKENFIKRMDVETSVMAGTKIKLTEKEKKSKVKEEEEAVINDVTNEDPDERYAEPESETNDGTDEDDMPGGGIGLITLETSSGHELAFPSSVGRNMLPVDNSLEKKFNQKSTKEESFAPRLKEGGDVIYVKTEDKTGRSGNGSTIYILGQLYNSDNMPVNNRYAVLGIMGEEEYLSEMGVEINKRVIGEHSKDDTGNDLYNTVDPNASVVSLKHTDNPALLEKTIMLRGKLKKATPLTYSYSKDKVTFSGPGFIDKLYAFVNEKLFGRSSEDINYSIQIFTQKSKMEYSDIKDLYVGVPYLLIKRKRKGGTAQKTQFIRLNPSFISKDNQHILKLSLFYDALEKVENITGDRGKLGSEQFNEMIELFSHNYHIVNDKVEFKEKALTYEYYESKAKAGYVIPLEESEFDELTSIMTPVIVGTYGKGKKRSTIASLEDMKDKYHLNDKLENEGVRYEFEKKEGKDFGYVREYNATDDKDKGDYKYEDTIRAGRGEAQTAFNIIAKANNTVSGKTIRVRTLVRRNSKGLLAKPLYVTGAKSIVSTIKSNEGYYSALRKIMQEHKMKMKTIKDLGDGKTYESTHGWYVNDENLDETIKIILDNGWLVQSELDKLKKEFDTDLITSDLLKSIVRFEGSKHPELMTPLVMQGSSEYKNGINDWGENKNTIEENKELLEDMLQSSIEDIVKTSITVDTDFNTTRIDDMPEEDNEINKEEDDLFHSTLKAGKKIFNRGKKLRDDGQPFIGKKANTERSVRRKIKRMIPDITDKEVEFMDKLRIDSLAGEKAWGLFKHGIIYLSQSVEGKTYDLIARHEVFHKIFNQYLTKDERKKVEELAAKEFPDYKRFIDIDEFLAVKFQDYRRGFLTEISDFFKSLFDKFKKIIGMYNDNIKSIDDLFYKINYGLMDIRHNKSDNTTKLMKDINKRFGSIDIYLKSIDIVHDLFRSIRVNGIKGIPSTHLEIREAAKKMIARTANYYAEEYKKTGDEVMNEYAKIYSNIIEYKNGKDNFKDLIKDIYPGFNNYSGGVHKSKLSEEVKAEIIEGRPSVNNNMHIIDNSMVNNENDVTNEVKEFLSYVRGEDGDFLSWRYVYIKMIDMFEGLSLEQRDSEGKYHVIEQIRDGLKGKDLTANEVAILDNLKELYGNMTGNINSMTAAKMPDNVKFITSNVFIYSDSSVDMIKHINDPRIRDGSVKFIQKTASESSVEFAARIDKIMGYSEKARHQIAKSKFNMEYNKLSDKDRLMVNQIATRYAAKTLHHYGIKQYSNEMFNLLVNNFNSHRQRQPKIGERKISYGSYEIRYINARGNAVSNGIKENIAMQIGNKIKTDKDIDDLKYNVDKWDNDYKSDIEYVRAFFKYIGLYHYAGTLTNHNVSVIKQGIKSVFPKLKGIVGKPINVNKSDEIDIESETDNDIEKEIPVYTTTDLLLNNYNSFLNQMTDSVSLLDNLSRILSSTDANNKKRYNAVLTSQGHKNIFNVINSVFGKKMTGNNSLLLNKSFRTPFFKKNIFINGINKITSFIDDDGFKYNNYNGDEYGVSYKDEKREDFNFRQFVLGFITSINNSTDSNPKYIQFIYPNERKTAFGAEVSVLNREKLLASIKSTIEQIMDRDVNNESKYSGYNVNSLIGFEVLAEALGERSIDDVSLDELSLDIYNLLDQKSHTLTDNIVFDRTPFDSNMPKGTKLDNIVDKELYPYYFSSKFETNSSGHLKINETTDEYNKRNKGSELDWSNAWEKGEEKKYLIKSKQIQPLVSAYFINNYLNSYHLTQLIVGDFAAFVDTRDLSRRLSIALAPGRTGYVNDRYGMNTHARVAVINDPVQGTETINNFFKGLVPEMSESDLADIMKHFPKGGFKPGDAQGFILPERLDDINFGFGSHYGNVLKGVYYHIDGDNIARALKYSSIVLSDQLCERYKGLDTLRNKMRGNVIDGVIAPIDEAVFKTGVKVGIPGVLNEWKSLMKDDLSTFHPESQFMIDNSDYRIQMDPEADLDSDVSYPSQLSYIMNLFGTNNQYADTLYSSLASIMKYNFDTLRNWMTPSSFETVVNNFLEKTSQENLKELLSDGISPNFPSITDKILVHYISSVFERAIKTKFAGSKLVLQSALGTEKLFESKGITFDPSNKRELNFQRDQNGRFHGEFIIPEGLLDIETEKRIKKALSEGKQPDDYFVYNDNGKIVGSKDLVGFRIPSSEMHSAVIMKVVGFYDSHGTNVVIGPELLVVLHGSDFDVDALFTIKRSIVNAYDKTVPVGYSNVDGKFLFNDDPRIIEDIEDPQIKRDVNEAFHLNKIIETYIKSISSKDNIYRMIDPIYVGELQEEKNRMLQLTKQKDIGFAISDANDQQSIHDTIFSGESGVGMIMSMFKAFAFMHRAMKGHAITELKDGGTENKIRFNGNTYVSMTDTGEKKDDSGYRFDALANSALDNFKEMILPYLNIGKETIRAYTMMVMHGIPFNTINNFIAQPVLRAYTKYGKRDADIMMHKLATLVNEKDVEAVELTDEMSMKYLSDTPEDVKQLLEVNDLDESEVSFLTYQLAVYNQYNRLKTIGDKVSKVNILINSIRSFPVTVADLENTMSIARSIFGIKSGEKISDEIDDTDSPFPYTMDNFLKTNPHLFASLKAMEWLVDAINKNFSIYSPVFRKIAERVSSKTKIKIDKTADASNKKIRDEFVRFIMSSLVTRDTKKSFDVYDKKDKKRTLTGVKAYNKQFVENIKDAKEYDQIRVYLTKGDEIPYVGNIFLNSISIKKFRGYGEESVVFHGQATMDPKDYNLYKQAFEQLNNFDFDLLDGKWKLNENPTLDSEGYTTFQRMFVDYAILNYGMSFGMRNYSKVLPGRVYKEISDRLINMMEHINGLDEFKIDNIVDAFKNQLALNYPEGIKSRIKVDDKNIHKISKVNKEDPKKKIYSGTIDGIYYDRLFTSETVKEDWPEYHVEKWDDEFKVYKRFTGPEGTSAMYIKIGKKNNNSVYDLIDIDDAALYNEKRDFNDPIIESKLRIVKGTVVGGFIYTGVEGIVENQLITISAYSDPGNMYAKQYQVKKVYEGGALEVADVQLRSYEAENAAVRKAYRELESSLKKRKDIYRVYNDRIMVKKQTMGLSRELWQKINMEQFGGLKVLSEFTTITGTEIRIDGELLAKWLYGRQLDLFSKGFGIINEMDEIEKVTGSINWQNLTSNVEVRDESEDNKLKEFNTTYTGKTIEELLDGIESRSKSKFQKLIISWVRPMLKGSILKFDGEINYDNQYGRFVPTGEIGLNYNKLIKDGHDIAFADRVLLHEMIHAITEIQLMEDSAFKATVGKWMQDALRLNKDLKTLYPYAFKDAHEFLSEFFSNEALHDDLNKLRDVGEKRNLLQKIYDWFMNLFTEKSQMKGDLPFTNQFETWFEKNIKMLPYVTVNKDGQPVNYKGEVIDLTNRAFTTLEDTTTLKKIVEDNSELSNPKNPDGSEADHYVDTEGTIYRRMTDIYTGWISLFRRIVKKLSYGERMANEEWGVTDHAVKKNLEGKDMDYAEYKTFLDTRSIKSEVRGRILHLMDRLNVDRLYNNGKNEGRIRAEIQNIAYKDYEVTDSEGVKTKIPMDLNPDDYAWYSENIKDIYRTHDINVYEDIPKDLKDFMVSEVTIASKELKFAGTADKIIEHADGTLSIKDLATGTNFDKFISNRMLKYGDQNRQIIDSPRDRKKMQVMMYAFIIKLQNKDVKFRDLSIMWVPNKYQATLYDPSRKVDVDDYLGMIQSFLRDKKALKEAGIDENIYTTLLQKSPKIFDVAEYTYEYKQKVSGMNATMSQIQDEVIEELTETDKDPAKVADRYIKELTRIIQKQPVIVNLGKNDYKGLSISDKVRAMNLTNKILQIIKDPNVAMNVNSQLDVSVVTSWIGNYSDMSVPQVQMWKKFADEQRHKANLSFLTHDSTQKSLLRKVLDDYYKANPLIVRNKKYMNFNNYKKIYGFMYKDFDNNGSSQSRMLHRDIAEDKEAYDALTDNQRNYIDFLNNHYASYFEGPDAYANSIATYVPAKGGVYKAISVIDLYNKDIKESQQFKYYKGWFPKAHKEESEMIYEMGEGSYLKGLLNPKFLKDMFIDSVTFFRENNYEGRTNAAMVLPLKNMGNFRVDNARAFSYNAEFAFDQFTKSIEYKKHMDPVYALGESVRMFLDMQTNKDQPMYANTSDMLEKMLTGDILGRTIRPKLLRKPLRVPFNLYGSVDDMEIRSDAILMLLKNWTSATLMWLKPITGAGNGINAMLLQHKDSVKGSIGSLKIFGIDGDAIDTTITDSLYADKEYAKFVGNLLSGRFEKDKMWLLAKKLRYMPDNFDYRSSDKYLLSTRNKLIQQSSLYGFHTMPEEFVSLITMVSQLNRLKHTKLKNSNGKSKSIYDCYEVEQLQNGEWDVVWKGGTRGMIKEGSGEMTHYKEMKELVPQEIAHLKKVYEKMQGGYRKEEMAAIEVYVLGKVFMGLKKYYPRLLLNAFSSKRKEADLGFMKKMSEQHEGEDIYEWYQRVNEGRFRILSKMMLSMAMMGAGNRDYKWNNMPPELKLHVIDAAVTLGMFTVAYVGYLKMFDDDKDDDSMKMWWKMYLMDNFVQQYSPVELLKIGVQGMQPVAFTRSMQTVAATYSMMGATWELANGNKEDAYTKEGDFKGWKQFRKSIPFFASYYDFASRVERNEGLTNLLGWDRINKWR